MAEMNIEKVVIEISMKVNNELGTFIEQRVAEEIGNVEYQVNIKRIVKAIKQAEKYKWHDLRKNPNDLPTEYATVEVVVSTVMIYDIAIYRKDYGFRPWYAEVFQDCPEEWKHEVMAWRYVGPFESEVE